MENINLLDIPEHYKEFLAMPETIGKKILSKDYTSPFYIINYGKEGNRHYFSVSLCNILKRWSKHRVVIKEKQGFSFKDNKVQVWFGNNLDKINANHMKLLFTYMNWNFITPDMYSYITKTTLKGLFLGKITNPRDLLRVYLKSIRINCSVQNLYKCIGVGLRKKEFYKYAVMAKNVDHMLERYLQGRFLNIPHFQDTLQQFELLEKKFDFSWSNNRIAEEHTKATEEIMQYEIDIMEDEKISYPDVKLPEGFELINTKKRLFQEGMVMSHCVFTNYWHTIKDGNYIAFHISYNGEECTLGCYTYNNKLTFNQLYKKRNVLPSSETVEYVKNWVLQNEEIFSKQLEAIE